MRRTVLILLMLLAVTVAMAHEERRWPAWLSAGQNDAVRTASNILGTISQTTLLTPFGDFGKVDFWLTVVNIG